MKRRSLLFSFYKIKRVVLLLLISLVSYENLVNLLIQLEYISKSNHIPGLRELSVYILMILLIYFIYSLTRIKIPLARKIMLIFSLFILLPISAYYIEWKVFISARANWEWQFFYYITF